MYIFFLNVIGGGVSLTPEHQKHGIRGADDISLSI